MRGKHRTVPDTRNTLLKIHDKLRVRSRVGRRGAGAPRMVSIYALCGAAVPGNEILAMSGLLRGGAAAGGGLAAGGCGFG